MDATPRIQALATAVPPFTLPQGAMKDWARTIFNGHSADIERLLPAFDNAGIEMRYSSVPIEWYATPHGLEEKNRLYIESALDLLERAARDCLGQAGLAPDAVDAIVTVSTSGIATPSLDARLKTRLGLREDVIRLPIFGLGCAGGVLGLARAAEVARAQAGRRVLFLVVELCGLTFRHADRSKSNIIATVLFGDGAAAALLASNGDGLAITGAGEHTWPDSLDVMGWRIKDDGFGVLFSHDIPNLVRREFRGVLDAYLAKSGLTAGDIDRFICHPGGAKVIQALEESLELGQGALTHTREVLRDFGNMSAATVMFVLERVLKEGARGRFVMSALGPGFTAGFLTLEQP